jgi:ribosomal protein S18 acetylase RimI-like enzyme
MYWIPRWISKPIRRYVAWTERNAKVELVTLRLPDLQAWPGPAPMPPKLEILRLPELGDERLLREVYNHAARDSPGFKPARLIDMIAFAAAPNHDPHSVFIARLSDELVGTCVARQRSDGTGMIYSVSVRSEFRRRGLARALLQAGLAHLKGLGASQACLYAHPENAPAISLYLREGFALEKLPPPPGGVAVEPSRGRRRPPRRAAATIREASPAALQLAHA